MESSTIKERIADERNVTGYNDSLHHISDKLQLLTLKLFREFQRRKSIELPDSSESKGFYIPPKSCNRLTADCRKSPIIVEYSIS